MKRVRTHSSDCSTVPENWLKVIERSAMIIRQVRVGKVDWYRLLYTQYSYRYLKYILLWSSWNYFLIVKVNHSEQFSFYAYFCKCKSLLLGEIVKFCFINLHKSNQLQQFCFKFHEYRICYSQRLTFIIRT